MKGFPCAPGLAVAGAILLLCFAETLLGDDVALQKNENGAPTPVRAEDFQQLLEDSPFTRSLNRQKSLVLTGVAVVDGSPMAICLDIDTGRPAVISETPNERGLSLIEIQRLDNLRTAVAVIAEESGGTFEATYDEQLIKRSRKRFRFANMRRAQQFALAAPDLLPDWIRGVQDPVMKGSLIQSFIERGGFDAAPFQAVDMALAVPEDQARGPAVSAAFGRLGGGVGGVEIVDAVNRLNAIPQGRDRDFAINGLAHGLVGRDPDSALKWANSISNEGFRNVVVKNVTRRIEARKAQSGRR